MDIICDKLDKCYVNCEFALNLHKNASHDYTEAEKTVIFYQGRITGGVMMLSHLLPSDLLDEYMSYGDELIEKMYALLEPFERKQLI